MIERKNAIKEENRYIFRIMGDEYVIKGKDDVSSEKASPGGAPISGSTPSNGKAPSVEEIVSYLESAIDSVASNNPKLSKCQIAVLAALKIADEFHKLRQEYQYLDELLKQAR